jgi:hypothetical protein
MDINSVKRAFFEKMLQRDDIKNEYLEFVKKNLSIENRVKLTAREIKSLICGLDVDYFIDNYDNIDEYEIVKISLDIFETEIDIKIKEYDVSGLINLFLGFYIAMDKCEVNSTYFEFSYEYWVKIWLKEQIEKVCKYIDFSEFRERVAYLLEKFDANELFECIYLQLEKNS